MFLLSRAYTVPTLNIVDQIVDYFCKIVVTTVITADTQCRNVATNCNYESDLHKNPTILKVGTVALMAPCSAILG